MNSGVCTAASFTDVSRAFESYCDQAEAGPVVIERNGASGVVMVSASEYERLARLDHVALLPSELEDDDLAAMRSAVVAQRHRPGLL